MKRHQLVPILILAAATALSACDAVREGMEGHMDALARADGFTLTVEHAAELLAGANAESNPASTPVVDRLGAVWVGYTMLFSELMEADTFAHLDLDPLTRLPFSQALVWQLRDQVVLESASPPEDVMRSMYEEDPPFGKVEARHILIRVPSSATEADVDSLREFAEEIRQRALAGEDFGQLARTYSQDPSSAARGGDLGWIERRRLVPEVEGPLFRMKPGEISKVVRSQFGFHVLEVTGRRIPDFDTVRDQYAAYLSQSNIRAMERVYIDSLTRAADLEFAPAAVGLVRREAASARLSRLSPAERSAALVRYRGGELTVGEWADIVVRGQPRTQDAFSNPDSAVVAGLLTRLVQNELLARAARDHGLTLTPETADSILEVIDGQLREAAAAGGFRPSAARTAERIPEFVDRAIGLISSAHRSTGPLDRVLPAMTNGRYWDVYPWRYQAAVDRLVELRAAGSAPSGEPGDAASEGGT